MSPLLKILYLLLQCKTLSVSPEETARGAVCAAVTALDLPRHGNYQLWAQSAREEAPYPLIGHERPAAIKLSCLRDALSAEEGFDLDHCNNVHDPLARCTFILRYAVNILGFPFSVFPTNYSLYLTNCFCRNACKNPESGEKKSPKKMSNRMRIGQVFRRSLSKESPGCLFGLPLSRICQGDSLPPPVVVSTFQTFFFSMCKFIHVFLLIFCFSFRQCYTRLQQKARLLLACSGNQQM